MANKEINSGTFGFFWIRSINTDLGETARVDVRPLSTRAKPLYNAYALAYLSNLIEGVRNEHPYRQRSARQSVSAY